MRFFRRSLCNCSLWHQLLSSSPQLQSVLHCNSSKQDRVFTSAAAKSIKMATSIANSGDSGITKEFLEKALGHPVDKFEVKAGSLLGDGYMCVLHSVEVWTGSESKNIVIKCYPQNPARQGFIDALDMFSAELNTYRKVVAALEKFKEEHGVNILLPFAPLIHGEHWTKSEQKRPGRPIESNCIVLPDLRVPANGSFRLRDRFLGLDLDHYKLVVENQAKVHAISWALKVKLGIEDIKDAYPFTDMSHEEEVTSFKHMISVVPEMFRVAEEMFKSDQGITNALTFTRERFDDIMGLYFGLEKDIGSGQYTKDTLLKKPQPFDGPEERWSVLLHGDAWSNNIMFRYDAKTNKPIEAIFIDLQGSRDGDPTADLAYTLYTSTTADFRKKHLESMLHLYFDTFTSVCKSFGVPTLPGFTWEELLRRFRRAKIFGLGLAIFAMPVMLKKSEDVIDMETVVTENIESEGIKELVVAMQGNKATNPMMEARLRGVIEEAISDGIV